MKIIEKSLAGDAFQVIVEVPRIEVRITQFQQAQALAAEREEEVVELVVEEFFNETLSVLDKFTT